jgi:hypothetical protein
MNNDTAKQCGEQIRGLRLARKLSIRGLASNTYLTQEVLDQMNTK